MNFTVGFTVKRNEPLCEAALRIVEQIYQKFGVKDMKKFLAQFTLTQTNLVKFEQVWGKVRRLLKKEDSDEMTFFGK